jgi:hypothetical protein
MIASISERLEEMQELTAQLDRQHQFYKKFGLHAHEISKILLTPKGRDRRSNQVIYRSVVTMKNGEQHKLDMNVKEFLDGETNE